MICSGMEMEDMEKVAVVIYSGMAVGAMEKVVVVIYSDKGVEEREKEVEETCSGKVEVVATCSNMVVEEMVKVVVETCSCMVVAVMEKEVVETYSSKVKEVMGKEVGENCSNRVAEARETEVEVTHNSTGEVVENGNGAMAMATNQNALAVLEMDEHRADCQLLRLLPSNILPRQ